MYVTMLFSVVFSESTKHFERVRLSSKGVHVQFQCNEWINLLLQ